MNHKRRRHPGRRAGCKMCKPQKNVSGYKGIVDKEIVHYGFGKIRANIHTREDMKNLDYG